MELLKGQLDFDKIYLSNKKMYVGSLTCLLLKLFIYEVHVHQLNQCII